MQNTLQGDTEPFVTAFICSTLDPQLCELGDPDSQLLYCITDIKLVSGQIGQAYRHCESYDLGQGYRLDVWRNPRQLPVVDTGNFEEVPPGWEPIILETEILSKLKSIPCLKRGSISQSGKCYSSLEFLAKPYPQKDDQILQSTQPSLSTHPDPYLQFTTQKLSVSINFITVPYIDLEGIRFKSSTISLYENQINVIDVPNLNVMCFPEGVRISIKQSGFKLFSFILTNDSAQRFYCNSITFYERCPREVEAQICQKYGSRKKNGSFFHQKVFTLISRYSCTDNTKKCLQYVYRLYLTKSYEYFSQQIPKICQNFQIQAKTHYARFSSQQYSLSFKINSSYPQTSNQAIYAVFKFLSVENIVTVVESLLLERKVFFVSKCENLLGMAIQAFLSFLYPLNWVHTIINPLSISMIEYKDAPMTVIFGISDRLAHKLQSNTDCLLVYLDQNRIQSKESSEKNLTFQLNLRKQLITRLSQFSVYDEIDIRDYLNNPQNLSLFKTQKVEDPHFDSYKIRNIFFQLTVFMLRSYNDYFRIKQETRTDLKNSRERERARGLKKYYNIDGLIKLYNRDQFMKAFFKTSLFSVLVEKKYQEPNNKWIKTLDRAIRKITSYNKHFIQQQSDNFSDTNEPVHTQKQKEENYFPKGCLNMISIMSRSDQEQSSSKSSPSPQRRKKPSVSKQFEEEKCIKLNRTVGRMSLPNEYEKRHQSIIADSTSFIKKGSTEQPKKKQMPSDSEYEKQQKQTDKDSQNYQKSSQDIPQLKQYNPHHKHQQHEHQQKQSNEKEKQKQKQKEKQKEKDVIVYEFDVEPENEKQGGVSYRFCCIFSYPYKKVSKSVVSRWTSEKLKRLKSWRRKLVGNQEMEDTVEISANMPASFQQSPQQPPKQPNIQ